TCFCLFHIVSASCRCSISTLLPYTTLFRSLHSRVARSNVDLLRTLGAEVVLIAPPTLVPCGVEQWGAPVHHELDPQLPKLDAVRSEEHTSELQSRENLVCRSLLQIKKRYFF